MCELFGLTGPDEITVNEYLRTFSATAQIIRTDGESLF